MQVDPGSIPGLGRSLGEGKGYPLQYFGLENSMDFIVHGIIKSRTRLSDLHFTLLQYLLVQHVFFEVLFFLMNYLLWLYHCVRCYI